VKTIEIYFDPRGIMGNGIGCWRAHLAGNYCISGIGDTKEEAIADFLSLAERVDESGKRSDYNVVEIPAPH